MQRIDVTALQTYAEKSQIRITLAVLSGNFSAPGRALAYVTADSGDLSDIDTSQIAKKIENSPWRKRQFASHKLEKSQTRKNNG